MGQKGRGPHPIRSEESLVILEQGTKIPQRQEIKVRVVHENISPGEVCTKS